MKITAIVLFVIMYVLMIAFPKRRSITALTTAAVFIILSLLPIGDIKILELADIPTAVNWNVILMISGTMIIVDYFIESKMPNVIAESLLRIAPNILWVTVLMSVFSGLISAFIDNVATVLMVAPVAMVICKKLNVSPVGMIICIAVSSNLQGAATLVGDTTSIMLAGAANMNFADFFVMHGKLGMFFATELGAFFTIPIMMFMFRKEKAPVTSEERTKVKDLFPSFMMIAYVLALIIASFIPNTPDLINGYICITGAVITVIGELLIHKDTVGLKHSFKSLDIDMVLLLIGLFCVIGGITNVGVIDDLAGLIANAGGNNKFLLFTIVVWGSVAISAFIDNIPYVATMLPILASVSTTLGVEPYFLFFGLLVGATLGGNLTPIGASANIAGVGMLRKAGYEVSFGDFMKIGVPFTLTAVMTGYLFVWFIWA